MPSSVFCSSVVSIWLGSLLVDSVVVLSLLVLSWWSLVFFFSVFFLLFFFSVFFFVIGNVSFLVVVVGGWFGCLTVRGDGGGAVDGSGDERDGSEGGGGDFCPGRATAGGRFGVDLHLGRLLLFAVLVGWRRLPVENSVSTVFVGRAFCRFVGLGHCELEDDSP